MKLRPRLALAAAFCDGTRAFIEIGCDHAQLSAFMALNGAKRVLACDLRVGPLLRAADTVRTHGLEKKIELRRSDGLAEVSPDEGDTIAICGMGGELIAEILRASPWALEGAHRLVLQPQSKSEVLREFLARSGAGVVREALARDAGKLYCVIEARGGAPVCGEDQMYLFTEKLFGDGLFQDFLREQAESRRKIIEMREDVGLDCARDTQILKMLEKYQNAT